MRKINKENWRKIKNLYPNYTDSEIAKKLGVHRGSVATIAKQLGLKKPNPRAWKKKEINDLLKYYEYGIAFAMNKLPNRSKWAIVNKYRELKGKR